MLKTYHILTYGCQMNKNDSEHLAGMLEFEGYKPVEDYKKANLVVLNTCSIRKKAEDKAFGMLLQLNSYRKRYGIIKKIAITGCSIPAHSWKKIINDFPFLDGFYSLEDARQYPAKRESDKHAWISIMYGCNNYCSYCIVPYVRGREKNRRVDEIKNEIENLDKKYSKIMLLGQNVNSYQGLGDEGNIKDFADLLYEIHDLKNIKNIGFMTSHPKNMTDKIIEALTTLPKIDNNVHFPIQHGHNEILEKMNRRYTVEQYKSIVQKFRAKKPDIKISTDFIVGFPGETEEHFQASVDIVRELKFSRCIMTAFSPRPGTKAAKMEYNITSEEKARRLQILMKIVDEVKNGSKEKSSPSIEDKICCKEKINKY